MSSIKICYSSIAALTKINVYASISVKDISSTILINSFIVSFTIFVIYQVCMKPTSVHKTV